MLESELEDRFGKPLYTRFETGDRPIRPKQAYLTKLPADLVATFSGLESAGDQRPRGSVSVESGVNEIGEEYRRPDGSVMVATADPFDRDPAPRRESSA